MPKTIDTSNERTQRTLAQKLQWLREITTPRGEQPPSYEATARRVAELTGVSISGPYFWELATGRATNPKLHHLRALARYFRVPVAYLADDGADFRQLKAELELLHALKTGGVRAIGLQGTKDAAADLPTLQALLGRLTLLEGFGDEEARETALRLQALPEDQRAVVHAILGDPVLLAALHDEDVRELARAATELSPERRATAAALARQPELLDALRAPLLRETAASSSRLSPASQRAVLALVEHLRRMENPEPPHAAFP